MRPKGDIRHKIMAAILYKQFEKIKVFIIIISNKN